MSDAGKRLLEGAAEMLAIAKGDQPAARIHHNGHAYAPEAELATLRARVEELERERDEARRLAGLGCDAADGGAHSIIKQGSYQFCHRCGYTIRNPTLHERARAAESRLSEATRLAVEALEPFVAMADKMDGSGARKVVVGLVGYVQTIVFRRARTALDRLTNIMGESK